MLIMSTLPVWKHHKLLVPFNPEKLLSNLKDIFTIAIPAIITNVATPIGTAYVIAVMAQFGDSAVAGMSITGRLTPVAFAVVFAVSGAIGPIIGQAIGASIFGLISIIWVFIMIKKLSLKVDFISALPSEIATTERRKSLRDSNVAVKQSP
jgi:Na+-driven multidrug efflux pump